MFRRTVAAALGILWMMGAVFGCGESEEEAPSWAGTWIVRSMTNSRGVPIPLHQVESEVSTRIYQEYTFAPAAGTFRGKLIVRATSLWSPTLYGTGETQYGGTYLVEENRFLLNYTWSKSKGRLHVGPFYQTDLDFDVSLAGTVDQGTWEIVERRMTWIFDDGSKTVLERVSAQP